MNQWIRTSGAFDGVIDFDAAARDPGNPKNIKPSLTRATISIRTTPATRPWPNLWTLRFWVSTAECKAAT